MYDIRSLIFQDDALEFCKRIKAIPNFYIIDFPVYEKETKPNKELIKQYFTDHTYYFNDAECYDLIYNLLKYTKIIHNQLALVLIVFIEEPYFGKVYKNCKVIIKFFFLILF